jgi:hypothetical protein
MKCFSLLISCFLIVGCARQHPSFIGLRDLDEARQVADDFMLRASAAKYVRSADTCKLEKEDFDAFTRFAIGWPRASVRQYPKWTKLMNPAEYSAMEQKSESDFTKNWANQVAWNHQPEMFLVYQFEAPDGKASAQMTVGLFRREGLWYFASLYTK